MRTTVTVWNTITLTCARNSPRPTSKPERRPGKIFAAKTGRKCSSPIATAPVPASVTGLLQAIVTGLPIVTGPPQLIVIGPLRAIAMDPAWVVEIDPARLIEIGRKLAISGVAKTVAKGRLARRPRKLVRRRARKRASSQVRRRASGRASRSATPLFRMSNQAPRLTLKPIVAAKASAVAEDHLEWPRVVAEEHLASVARRPAWVAEDEAAVAGGPMLRLSTTLPCSADSTTALGSIASATKAATKSMSASWRRRCK